MNTGLLVQALSGNSIQAHFERFHQSHPEVYSYLVTLAYQVKNTGLKHYGIGALYERARWHFNFETDTSETFKLNNNYRSRYARLITRNNPDLQGFFQTREIKSV